MTISIFLYTRPLTPVHHLDPRTKIWAILLLFGLGLAFNHPIYEGTILAGVLMLAWWSGSMANVWRLRYILLILMAFSTVLWPLFITGSTEVFRWRGVWIYLEPLLYGAAMGMRAGIFLVVGLIFLSTTRIEELSAALIKWKVPYPLAFAVSTAFRLLPTFVGAGATIVQAQSARGLDLEGGSLWGKMRKFIPLLVPILIYAMRTVNLQAMALEAKHFGGRGKRSSYLELRLCPIDYGVIFLLTLLDGVCLYWRLTGHGAVLPRL
ncbi:MAG: energy-coupling factor transporter transmembrane protein EcfT [Deltaproteobacteria bacterium]|nr:energy-coupling factor transporter transmembrane protein EcfT [Deltaproteobacteria bacterium]